MNNVVGTRQLTMLLLAGLVNQRCWCCWFEKVYININNWLQLEDLTLNLPTTTIVAQPFNVIKW